MSEQKDIIERLSRIARDLPETDDGATPVPIRIERTPQAVAEESLERAKEELSQGRDVVREYEEKYYGRGETARRRAQAERWAANGLGTLERSLRTRGESVRGLSDEERLWAALAHASALIMIGVAVVTGGWGALAMIFAPLAIYFAFREKSDFVAFHALQAFALQIVGTVGWLALLLVGVLVLGVAIAVSAVASVLLIGLPFLLIFVLLLVIFIPLTLALPFGMLIYAIIGAIQTYNGQNYRYPWIADWIDRQMSGSSVMTA